MRCYLLIVVLFSAILAVTFAYPLPDASPRHDKERVPSPLDEIPPFDDKPHPDTRLAKPFPYEQPPFDPQPYPGTKPFNPSQGEQPSFEPQPYPGSEPEQDAELLRVRRSPKNDKNEITVNDNPTNDSGISENNDGISRNKVKPQFAPIGSYPWY